MTSRTVACVAFGATLALALPRFALARDSSPATPTSSDAATARDLHARGQLLAIAPPYIIFVTGDALRLRAGIAIPNGATLGSAVLVSIDRSRLDVDRIALDAHASDEIDIAFLPREFVSVSPKSAPVDARLRAARTTLPGANAIANVTLDVTVPTNTPPADDVYVSTERSNFSPAEIRMQRVDSRRFTVTIPLDASGKLRYQYTRGSYATVERDRSGGIIQPHVADGTSARGVDTVTRWADTN